MFSLNFIKYFGVFAFALTISSACRFWQKNAGEGASPTPFAAEELISEIPFSTREPEIFQVEIVITTGGAEKKIFAAKSGARRRFDYNAGAKNQVSAVQTDKNYLIIESKKVYAETATGGAATENWTDFLTVEWLNARRDAKFFKLDAENNLAKYRVVFGDEETAKSESIIFVDENAGLPVRQEFYSLDSGQRALTMTVELKNLRLEAADDLFTIPANYRKASPEELRTILKKENE
jgi:hypothetical protein